MKITPMISVGLLILVSVMDTHAQVNSTNGVFNAASTTLPLALQTNAVTRATIVGGTGTTAGFMGLGTTTPTAKLDVVGSTSGTIMRVSGTSAPGNIALEVSNGGLMGVFESIIGSPNQIRAGSRSNMNFSLFSNNIDRLTILSSGFIGVNKATPAYQLDVNGTLNATGLYVNGSPFIGGQWTTSGTTINYTGSVGIGVAAPLESLHLAGSIRGSISGALRISSGYGTLDVGAQNASWAHLQTDRPQFYFNKRITVDEGIISSYNQSLQLQTAGVTALTIQNGTGIVSIGTTTAPTGYKLAVGGKIISEELVIKLQGNWPDYVFESSYQLPSFSELEKFIIANKHLPGVPTASEIEENGVSVGQMNAVLLKKVEELTLLMIDQNRRIEKQQEEIEALKKKLK